MQSRYTIVTGRKKFREDLSDLYDTTEIDSLYSMVVEYVLGFTNTQQLLYSNNEIDQEKWQNFQDILSKLKVNEPIQYIINESDFYGLKFSLQNNVLIPRQETELLVDLIIKEHKNKEVKIIDIGTGSGCIAISLKKNLPQAQVTAIDISDKAIAVAKKNAQSNNVEVNFVQTDIQTLKTELGSFDIVVSNPPYVMDSEKELMKPNVLNHEPHLALFVPDNDALKFYKAIQKFVALNLLKGGQVWLEINEALGKETAEIFIGDKLKHTSIIDDLNGKQRFVKAW